MTGQVTDSHGWIGGIFDQRLKEGPKPWLENYRPRPRDQQQKFDFAKSVPELLEERRQKAEQGNWYPASGGSETPFTARSGARLQYMYQPSTGKHAYYHLGSDLILSPEEAAAHMGHDQEAEYSRIRRRYSTGAESPWLENFRERTQPPQGPRHSWGRKKDARDEPPRQPVPTRAQPQAGPPALRAPQMPTGMILRPQVMPSGFRGSGGASGPSAFTKIQQFAKGPGARVAGWLTSKLTGEESGVIPSRGH